MLQEGLFFYFLQIMRGSSGYHYRITAIFRIIAMYRHVQGQLVDESSHLGQETCY
jgi:hypothetical protein